MAPSDIRPGVPFLFGGLVAWTPHIGFETRALDARYVIHELGLFGDRGGGKTSCLLCDYCKNVQVHPTWLAPDAVTGERKIVDAEGPCRPWKGILFRRTYQEFDTLIERSKDVFYGLMGDQRVGGRAHFLEGEMRWQFYDERGHPYPDVYLLFSHMEHDSDVDRWIGNDFQWIGYDELPQWDSPRPYLKMFAALRSSKPDIPMRVRSTGNPGSTGIWWIKERFGIPDGPKDVVKKASGKPIITKDVNGKEMVRTFLLSLREENTTLRKNNPSYDAHLDAATEGDPELRKAWMDADFSSLFGKYFKQFNPNVHHIDPHDFLPGGKVPVHWRLEGSFDYGMGTAATSFGLWATSPPGAFPWTPQPVSIRLCEFYAHTEYPSEAAGGINNLIAGCPYTGGRRPSTVYCDSSIFWTPASAQQSDPNRFVAKFLARETNLRFKPAAKDRKTGWAYLKECIAHTEGRRPALYYTDDCPDFEREMLNAVYSEEINRRWDIDKACNDDALDESRYFVMGARKGQTLNFKETPKGMTFQHMMKRAKMERMGMTFRREAPVAVPLG